MTALMAHASTPSASSARVRRKRHVVHTRRQSVLLSAAVAVPPPPPAAASSPRATSTSRPVLSPLSLPLPFSSPRSGPQPSPLPSPLPSPTVATRVASASPSPSLSPSGSPTKPRQRPHLRIDTELSASSPPRLTSSSTASSNTNRTATTTAFRLSDFFYKEVFGVHDVKASDEMHQERVQNFLVVPYRIEQLFAFGVLLALDSFLYVFTYLPLRILFACGCAVTSSFYTRVFRRTHFYDLMVAVILAVGTAVLAQVDMSRVYHAIRGQAMIKLYVLLTMIEIFDRLFSSLGQDVLDSLYYTARYQPRRFGRMAMDFAVAIVYVVTINVAINSSNSSLLTLLISNNFAELKTSVFKKFEEQNLFQIACSDIVERFKLCLIVGLIMLQSNAEDVAYGTTMVLGAEMVIDWLKHAFITKFNQIPPVIYSKFITILCRDLTGWKNEDTILDHTHHVSRRLGLVSLPLACVVLRMVFKALHDSAPFASTVTTSGSVLHAASHAASGPGSVSSLSAGISAATTPSSLSTLSAVLLTLAVFLCLVAFKALLSLGLMIYACRSGRLDDTRPKSPRAVRHLESIHTYKF